MCCCCPPAIQALFCLWTRSGFSKASVAGALTFFPPEPALYKFIRISKDGEVLSDTDSVDNSVTVTESYDGKNSKEPVRQQSMHERHSQDDDYSTSREDAKTPSTTTGKKPNPEESRSKKNAKQNESDESHVHPARALTQRAEKLRKLAKIRNERDSRDHAAGVTYRFSLDSRLSKSPRFSGTIDAIKIGPESTSGTYIAAILYRQSPSRSHRKTKTIIYSHGNATDIGAMNFMQCILAKTLECNVVMYDYSGYGESGGVPLEGNTYKDIQLVYQYVVDHIVPDRDESQIVLYGQSVGSGPSCYLCSKRDKVGGLILHSPFMSGMRVLTPNRLLACLDIFPNIDRIKKVKCPVMIIHGARDEEVNITHGIQLHEAVPDEYKRDPWWVAERGHNDITDGRSKMLEYIQKLQNFMDSLD